MDGDCEQSRATKSQVAMSILTDISLDAARQYSIGYYLGNMSTWPDMFEVQESADGNLMGYGSLPSTLKSFAAQPTEVYPCASLTCSYGQSRRP